MLRRISFVAFLVVFLLSLAAFSVSDSTSATIRREYDRDGNLISESQHDNLGRPHGLVTLYAPDGTVASTTRYYHGSWVWHKEFQADGTSVMK